MAKKATRTSQKTTSIAGFEILNKVGQGGMGAVFRARQVSMDRIVALKILAPKLADDRVFKQRFLNEARLSAKLNHANIVNGIDCGESGGYTYFAMEYVDGRTIAQILKEVGKYAAEESLEIIIQIADALDYARRQGLVHRDIKPDNIMLAYTGIAKLCDLGLAKQLERKDNAELTLTGQTVGTPHYLSPEQARGEGVDIRCDIYSLGVTFYHMLVGRTPFNADTSASIMAMHITETAPSPCELDANIPVGYGQVISKMMSKDKADRYATPEELLADLNAIREDREPAAAAYKAKSSCMMPQAKPQSRPVRARTATQKAPSEVRPQRERTSRNRAVAPVAWTAMSVLALVIVFVFVLIGGASDNANRQPANPVPVGKPANPLQNAAPAPDPSKKGDPLKPEQPAPAREHVDNHTPPAPAAPGDPLIADGLRWLAQRQEPDGHWDSIKYQCQQRVDTTCTSFALTALLKGGNSETSGAYQENVKRAIGWLRSRQQPNGLIMDKNDIPGQGVGYHHAIAGLALACAAGVSTNPETRLAAQRAVNYSTEIHQSDAGGFRYTPKAAGCISVSGWFIQQLTTAKAAGLNVDPASLEKVGKFLDSLMFKQGAVTVYYYRPKDIQLLYRDTMIGAASRLELGAKPEEVLPSILLALDGHLPSWPGKNVDIYLWHYATIATSLVGGDAAKRWNDALKSALAQGQIRQGPEAGSWPMVGQFSPVWGRIGETALACIALLDASKQP